VSVDVLSSLRAGAPKPCAPSLGLLPQPLELAAVGVGEGGGASQSQFDRVLVVEVLVLPIAIGVEVDVRECPAVCVLGVTSESPRSRRCGGSRGGPRRIETFLPRPEVRGSGVRIVTAFAVSGRTLPEIGRRPTSRGSTVSQPATIRSLRRVSHCKSGQNAYTREGEKAQRRNRRWST
jgi:hypothetical protein